MLRLCYLFLRVLDLGVYRSIYKQINVFPQYDSFSARAKLNTWAGLPGSFETQGTENWGRTHTWYSQSCQTVHQGPGVERKDCPRTNGLATSRSNAPLPRPVTSWRCTRTPPASLSTGTRTRSSGGRKIFAGDYFFPPAPASRLAGWYAWGY